MYWTQFQLTLVSAYTYYICPFKHAWCFFNYTTYVCPPKHIVLVHQHTFYYIWIYNANYWEILCGFKIMNKTSKLFILYYIRYSNSFGSFEELVVTYVRDTKFSICKSDFHLVLLVLSFDLKHYVCTPTHKMFDQLLTWCLPHPQTWDATQNVTKLYPTLIFMFSLSKTFR